MKKIFLTLLLTTQAQASDILPFTPLEHRKVERPYEAELNRTLASYILSAPVKENVKYDCYTDKGRGKEHFSDLDIQYQTCIATIHVKEGTYQVTVTNQNETRRDEDRTAPMQADYLSISALPRNTNITFIGFDEFIDGTIETGNQEEFSKVRDALLSIYQ